MAIPVFDRSPDRTPLLRRLGLAPEPDAGPTRDELVAERARLIDEVAAGGEIGAALVKLRGEYEEARATALERVRAKFAPRIAELERQAAARDAARRRLEQVEGQLRDSADEAFRVARGWLNDVRMHLLAHGRGMGERSEDATIERLKSMGVEPGLRFERTGRLSPAAALLEGLLHRQDLERRAFEKMAEVEALLERVAEAEIDPEVDAVAFVRGIVEQVGTACPSCAVGLPRYGES